MRFQYSQPITYGMKMRMPTEPTWTEDAGTYYLNIPRFETCLVAYAPRKAKFYVSE